MQKIILDYLCIYRLFDPDYVNELVLPCPGYMKVAKGFINPPSLRI